MKIVISIFLLPHEISILDNLLYSLNKASNHLSGDFHYFLDIGMSLSDEIINWDDSHLPKSFFTTWFKNLQKRTSWPDEIDFHFTKARGSLEYKRIKQKEYGSFDYVILIDSDIIFDEKILFHFENTYKNLKNTNKLLLAEQKKNQPKQAKNKFYQNYLIWLKTEFDEDHIKTNGGPRKFASHKWATLSQEQKIDPSAQWNIHATHKFSSTPHNDDFA